MKTAVGLEERPDALDNTWDMLVQELNADPYPLPAGTSITQVYDEADGRLLILGEPFDCKNFVCYCPFYHQCNCQDSVRIHQFHSHIYIPEVNITILMEEAEKRKRDHIYRGEP